jgi:hypothetical protein
VAKSAWLHFTHQTETSPELWDGATVNTLFFPSNSVNIFEINPAELTISLLLLAHKHFFRTTFPLQRRQIMFATSTGRQWQRSEFFYTLSTCDSDLYKSSKRHLSDNTSTVFHNLVYIVSQTF